MRSPGRSIWRGNINYAKPAEHTSYINCKQGKGVDLKRLDVDATLGADGFRPCDDALASPDAG